MQEQTSLYCCCGANFNMYSDNRDEMREARREWMKAHENCPKLKQEENITHIEADYEARILEIEKRYDTTLLNAERKIDELKRQIESLRKKA